MPPNDKFGYHELLHTAHIMASSWEDHIVNHAATDDDPELKEEAHRIMDLLGDFYQLVARVIDKHFHGGEDRSRDMFRRAFEIALDVHGNQTRHNGEPYILHITRVVNAVIDQGVDAMVLAALHDVVEDTVDREDPITLTAIRLSFPDHIVDALDAITHRKRESRKDYYDRVKANPLALAVKKPDINDNYSRLHLIEDEATRERLRKKYEFAAGYLGFPLPGE